MHWEKIICGIAGKKKIFPSAVRLLPTFSYHCLNQLFFTASWNYSNHLFMASTG